jgi:hypothetical protein
MSLDFVLGARGNYADVYVVHNGYVERWDGRGVLPVLTEAGAFDVFVQR